jgi:hypothetical protein
MLWTTLALAGWADGLEDLERRVAFDSMADGGGNHSIALAVGGASARRAAAAVCGVLDCDVETVRPRAGTRDDLALAALHDASEVWVFREVVGSATTVAFSRIRVDDIVWRGLWTEGERLPEDPAALRLRLDDALAGRSPPPTPIDREAERAASKLLDEAIEHANAFRPKAAAEVLESLARRHPGTRANRRADRLRKAIALVGRDVGRLEVVHWYQGRATFEPERHTLLLFCEVWDPHCKRGLTRVARIVTDYDPPDLQVVGLMRQSRGVSDERVTSFLAGLPEPPLAFGRDGDGRIHERFEVDGPSAAIVADGRIAWRGPLAWVTMEHLLRWENRDDARPAPP